MKHRASRREFLAMFATASVAIMAGACTPDKGGPAESPAAAGGDQAQATKAPEPTAAPAQEGRAVIRVVSGQDVTEIEVRQLIADRFNEAQDEATAEVVIVKGDRYESQQTMIAGGNAPDVLYMNPGFMYTFADKGVLLALDDYVARDNYSFDGVYQIAVEMGRYLGKLIAMPFEVAPLTIVYNKDLFDAAGVPYPTTDWEDPDWTWDAFIDTAAKLTNADESQYGVHIDNWMYMAFVYQNGGTVLTNRKEIRPDTKCALDSTEAVEAIQWMVDLAYTHEVHAPATATAELGGFDRFMAGKVAMYVYGRWLNTFRTIETFEWDVAALPHVPGKLPATLLLDLHYGTYSGSKNPDAAWEYLKFILTEEPQKANVNTGMAVAALERVNEMPVFLESAPPEHERVYIDALEFAVPEDVNPMTMAYNDPLWAELQGIFDGTRNVRDSLVVAASEVNRVLDEWKADNL